jgi:3-methylcrotonyl-CoA carboxylase alpha subunit
VFDSVLVANRGEIAVRVIGTLRRLGIRSIAVYSDGDRGARHVLEADRALRLGPSPSHESYLNLDRVLDAARESGAQAVHPGYGFFAESAAFARACARAGVAFIGPPPEAIELMGDKIRAKRHVSSAGVPVVPGTSDSGLTDRALVAAAGEIGFPVLVKPSAGGGGKGMRLVERFEDLAGALEGARREARGAFGDDTLLIERFIPRPRHLEVQVLADAHGATVHLGERECSLQRRHQKVVEEAPSPLVDDALRDRLGAAAVAAARSVGYAGVGTVEFIVSSERPEEFYFMEMNTRLQVEHPVTEMVTGLDLVEQQLLVAAGERLDPRLSGITPRGHAVEARVYAENPRRHFLPSDGRIVMLREPNGEGVRIDSGVSAGSEVATHYDPLLAKVVAWAPERPAALSRLRRALAETVILGVVTNLEFLGRLLAHPRVVSGDLDTGLIEDEGEGLTRAPVPRAAYAAFAMSKLAGLEATARADDPWSVLDGWRLGGRREPLSLAVVDGEGEVVRLIVAGRASGATLAVNGSDPVEISFESLDDHDEVVVDGEASRAWVATAGAVTWVAAGGATASFRADAPRPRLRGHRAVDQEIRSPMPGTIVAVAVETGARVGPGEPLVIVEAMKMEHVTTAPDAGTVTVFVHVGDHVTVDQVLVRWQPEGEPGPA